MINNYLITLWMTTLLLAPTVAQATGGYYAGEAVGNGAHVGSCSGNHGSLAWAQEQCDADPACFWLHDHACNGGGWRFCTVAFPTETGDGLACTMMKNDPAIQPPTVSTYESSSNVGNAAHNDLCSSIYGSLEWATNQCDADPACSWLHDFNCDGNGYRYCTGEFPSESGDGLACTRTKPAVPIGPNVLLNSATNEQRKAEIGVLSNGNFVVVYEAKSGGIAWDVYSQRFDASGNLLESEVRANSYTSGGQTGGKIAALTNDDYVIVWQCSAEQDGKGKAVFAQRYSSDGSPLGSNFQVNTHWWAGQQSPDVASLSNGGFVVSWTSDHQDGAQTGIFAQRFDNAGNKVGSEFQVNTYTQGNQYGTVVSGLSNGEFVIAWTSQGQPGGSYLDVFAQMYDNEGVASGSEFKVNTYITNGQTAPQIALLPNGDFMVTWQSYIQDGSHAGVYARRYDSSGNQIGDEFKVNTHTSASQGVPDIAVLADGGFVITWNSRYQDGSERGVFAQRFSNSGDPRGFEFQVNEFTTGNQQAPAVAGLPNGDFVIAWESHQQTSIEAGANVANANPFCEVFMQRYGVMTTYEPTYLPTVEPTHEPTYLPTVEPTYEPTFEPTSEPATAVKVGESQVDEDEITVSFNQGYDNPLVMLGVASHNGGDHAHPRIDSVTNTEVTFWLDESDFCNGGHVMENVAWAVFESDVIYYDGDAMIQTGKLEVTTSNFGDFTQVEFSTPFDSDDVVVMVTIQTHFGSDFVKPRVRQVSSNGFEVHLEETGTGKIGYHTMEVVGWVAARAGRWTIDGQVYDFGSLTMEDMDPYQVTVDPLTNPLVFGQIMTYAGTHPVNLRYTTKSGTGFTLRMDEDGCGDGDNGHMPETVGYMAIGDVPALIVGYNAISREEADTGTGMQFVSEYAFSDDGMLSGWDVYVNRQCSITLQVFRPSGTDYTYDLVDSTVANVNVGANSIPAWIEVEAGDVLGWYQSGVQPIVFDNGGLIVRRAYGYTGSDSTVSMSGHAGGWNRMYSISATVGPTSGRRQMRLMQMSEGEKNVKNARLYDDRQMKQAQKL